MDKYGFLFDLDGTLVNTDEAYYKAWEQILIEYNIFLTKTIYDTYIYSNDDASVKKKLLPNISITTTEISTKKEELFIKNIGLISVINNAQAFIKQLQDDGQYIAIVTNSTRKIAEIILNSINIKPDILIIGSECIAAKPSPEPYLEAMRQLNIDGSKCFVFEDSTNGIISAKGANVKCIVGISGPQNACHYIDADLIYSDYTFQIDALLKFQRKQLSYESIIKFSIGKQYNISDIVVDKIQLKGGFIADVFAVKMKIDGNPINTVIKLINNNDSPLNRMAHFLDLYDRENYFYESISKFVPINIPKCYGILRDTNLKPLGFILEDMHDCGAIINKDLNTESIDLSLNVISEMAKLHSFLWNKELDTNFKLLKKHNDSMFQPSLKEFIQSKISLFKQKWNNILLPKHIELIDNIANDYINIQNSLSCPPLTLCHGDIKSPNIFYKGDVPYFIDWQYIINGKGVQDLIFFMIESFNQEKIKYLYPLFKNYYYLKLKEYGVKDYSYEMYSTDIKNAMFYFPFFVAIWFGTTSNNELIDVNFPYFFIQKLFNFYDIVLDI